MTEVSKYNFPKAEKVQIFEQVDTYIEAQHNYTTDPSVQAAIMDLKALVTHLQSQHPTIANESEALAIIDAEFTEIQHSNRRFKSEVQHSVSEPLSAFAVMTTTRNTVKRSTAGYRSPS